MYKLLHNRVTLQSKTEYLYISKNINEKEMISLTNYIKCIINGIFLPLTNWTIDAIIEILERVRLKRINLQFSIAIRYYIYIIENFAQRLFILIF